MSDPELTVIVPTYNGARFLAAALDSLGRQEAPVTVLVVDDGSSDDSARTAEEHPAVAEVLRQENAGVAVARNRGMARATTPYVAFMDQDDMWHPTRAGRMLELARTTGAAAVSTTSSAFAYDEDKEALKAIGDGRDLWPSHWIAAGGEKTLLDRDAAPGGKVELLTLERLLQAPVSVTTSFMYRRESAIAAGGCATFVRAADDHVLNVNMARIFGSVPELEDGSLLYRVHPASTTTVSPLVAPYLTTLLALRHGRALPAEKVTSDYLDHLLWQMPDVDLPWSERIALLTLTVPAARRARWLARWTKRSAKRVRARS